MKKKTFYIFLAVWLVALATFAGVLISHFVKNDDSSYGGAPDTEQSGGGNEDEGNEEEEEKDIWETLLGWTGFY